MKGPAVCVLPPPQDPSHWAARVGHLQAASDAALNLLRRGMAPQALRVLEEASRIEHEAEDSFHLHLTQALQGIRRP